MSIPKLPLLSEEEHTPVITTLLEIIHLQEEMIQQLRDEIAILKGQKPKPQIKPSQLEKGPKDNEGKIERVLMVRGLGRKKDRRPKSLSFTRKKRSSLNILMSCSPGLRAPRARVALII